MTSVPPPPAATITLTVRLDRAGAAGRRCVTVPADTLLPAFADRLIPLFDHEPDHLYEFEAAGLRWSPRPDRGWLLQPFGRRHTVDAEAVRVIDLAARPGESFAWTYDLGAMLTHTCTVDEVRVPGPAAATATPGVDPALSAVFLDLVEATRYCACGCGEVADPELGPTLRTERPVAVAELAAAAGQTPLVTRVLALVSWLGAGRAVTPSGVLRPADVVDAVRALGLETGTLPSPHESGAEPAQGALSLPGVVAPQQVRPGRRSAKHDVRLHPIWSAAVGAGFIGVGSARAVGMGAAQRWAQASDAERVELWALLLGGYLRGLADALRVDRGLEGSNRFELLLDSVLFLQQLGQGALPMATLPVRLIDDLDAPDDLMGAVRDAEWVGEAWAVAGVVQAAPELPADSQEILDGALAELMAPDQVSALADLDPAELAAVQAVVQRLQDGPLVAVTALGRYGLARLLRAHGLAVPVAGHLRDRRPEDLLDALALCAPDDAQLEAELWLQARAGTAVDDVRRAVLTASSPALEAVGRRTALPLLLVAAGPLVAELMPVFAVDPWLAVAVAQARALTGEGPPLDGAQLLWAAVDVLWPLLEEKQPAALDAFAGMLDEVGAIALLESDGAVDAVRRLRHPKGAQVLRAALQELDPQARQLLKAEVKRLDPAPHAGSRRPGAGRAAKRRR